MGKFASSKVSRARAVASTAKPSAAAAAAPKVVSKPSAILKKTTFKAKATAAAKQPIKVPKHAVPKSRKIVVEPEQSHIKFDEPAKVPVVPAPVTATTTGAARHISKKEKIQNRHDNLMRKFDTALEARRTVQMKAKATKKQQRQQKQKITKVSRTTAQAVKEAMSDLTSLKNSLPTLDDALPSLNSLFQLKTQALRTGVPKFDAMAKRAAERAAMMKAKEVTAEGAVPGKLSKTTKTLNKKNEFMTRYNYFQKLSADKAFKRNPREVIAAHIRNRAAAEAEQPSA